MTCSVKRHAQFVSGRATMRRRVHIVASVRRLMQAHSANTTSSSDRILEIYGAEIQFWETPDAAAVCARGTFRATEGCRVTPRVGNRTAATALLRDGAVLQHPNFVTLGAASTRG